MAVALLLLIYCSMYFPFLREFSVCLCFCYALICFHSSFAVLCIHSSFAIILKRKRKLVAFIVLSYLCSVTINRLWPFLTVPWVGLRCVVLPDHTHLRFAELVKIHTTLEPYRIFGSNFAYLFILIMSIHPGMLNSDEVCRASFLVSQVLLVKRLITLKTHGVF